MNRIHAAAWGRRWPGSPVHLECRYSGRARLASLAMLAAQTWRSGQSSVEVFMASAVVVPPTGGEHLTARGSELIFKAVAATTGGAFSLHERRIPADGRRPPAHVHPDRAEAFWVLEGEAEFELDGLTTLAGPGTFVLVPGGVRHTFGASGTVEVRLLVLHAPALDAYFRDLERLWSDGDPPSRETELALMRKYGMEPD
jgi:mannose-6-phosphate isomerase-like protein (cupin superfamily)